MIDAISRKRATMNAFNMAIEIIRKRLGSHFKGNKIERQKKKKVGRRPLPKTILL